jgi:hypothetical protein
MSTIDIPLPDALTSALSQPVCLDLSLPKPEMPTLTLPTGAVLKGIADFTRGVPTECSMNFSLALMIAPIMASMQCLLDILKFLKSIIDAAQPPAPNPVDIFTALGNGLTALEHCLGLVTPAGICPFVKSLLLLITRMLHCVLDALKSAVETLDGLELSIATALQNGNIDEHAALECAKQNAENAAAGALTSIEPVTALLQIAEPFLSIANVKIDPLPDVFGSSGIAGLKLVVETLTPIVATIETIAGALPC